MQEMLSKFRLSGQSPEGHLLQFSGDSASPFLAYLYFFCLHLVFPIYFCRVLFAIFHISYGFPMSHGFTSGQQTTCFAVRLWTKTVPARTTFHQSPPAPTIWIVRGRRSGRTCRGAGGPTRPSASGGAVGSEPAGSRVEPVSRPAGRASVVFQTPSRHEVPAAAGRPAGRCPRRWVVDATISTLLPPWASFSRPSDGGSEGEKCSGCHQNARERTPISLQMWSISSPILWGPVHPKER